MDGYVSYFQDDLSLNLGYGYHITFTRYAQHLIPNLVTVGRQETSAINLDAKYLFIYYLDGYQVKNKTKIDIHPDVINLPTAQKAVGNVILQSGIANDLHGMRHLFFDSKYAVPQFLGIMQMEWNLLTVHLGPNRAYI
eukprot:11502090-Ditylum_brightwellii.AAC.1